MDYSKLLLEDILGFTYGDLDDDSSLRDMGVSSIALKGSLEELVRRSGKNINFNDFNDQMSVADFKKSIDSKMR